MNTILAPRRDSTEAEFQTAFLKLAKALGYLRFHPQTVRTHRSGMDKFLTAFQGDRGFPDVVLVRAPHVLFVELKKHDGTLRPDQRRWGHHLELSPGVLYRVYRPSDWNEIVATLAHPETPRT